MNASQWIDRLLKEGHCDPQVEEWMSATRAFPSSFYKRTKAAKGVEAAEAELAEVVAERNYHKVAPLVKSIVTNIGALAKISDEKNPSVLLIDSLKELRFPARWMSEQSFGKLIVAWNRGDHFTWGVCDSDERAAGLEVWLPRGTLKLRAITIAFGVINDTIVHNKLAVGLVFDAKARLSDEYCAGGDAFTVITLQPDGTMHWDTVTHQVRKGSALRLALGVGDREPEILQSSGGNIESHLTFLGSYDYLLKHLPSLPRYLSDIAKLEKKKKREK